MGKRKEKIDRYRKESLLSQSFDIYNKKTRKNFKSVNYLSVLLHETD